MKIQLLLSSRKKKTILFLILVVLGLLLLSNFFDKHKIITTYHQSQWNEYVPDVERALRNQVIHTPIQLNHVYGAVVSHHIPTALPKLVELYSRLKDMQKVTKFIVIGPDHNDAGLAPITASNESFLTAFGEVKPIDGLAVKLQNLNLVHIDETPFDPEHSIGSQMLVISKIFPEAQVLPIILRSNTTKGDAEVLGKKIASLLDDETVLIASVDFSHYLATDQAMSLDAISGEVVRNLDLKALSLIKADSGKSMQVFIQAMSMRGASSTSNVEVLNTNDLMQNSDYTTGYVFGYWGK